ncbi:MAG: hypothetical protein ACOYNG_04585, partial [Terrimicrobiaceae bacterium]
MFFCLTRGPLEVILAPACAGRAAARPRNPRSPDPASRQKKPEHPNAMSTTTISLGDRQFVLDRDKAEAAYAA